MFGALPLWGLAVLLAVAAVVMTWTQLGPGLAVLVAIATAMLGLRLIVAR
jgi:hypothetical protein